MAIFQSLPVNKTLKTKFWRYFCLIQGGWDGMFSAAEVQVEVKKTVQFTTEASKQRPISTKQT